MTEFHPSSGYRWKSMATDDPSSTSSITPSSTAGAGATASTGGVPGASSSSTTSAAPGITAAGTGANAAGAPKPGAALSQDFMFAVDRAIKTVDQRQQQFKLQSGNAAASGSTLNPGVAIAGGSGLDKVKQEGVGVGSSSSSAAAARNAPKAANKRRKKSEEASVAAANMGINPAMGINTTQQGRSPTAGGGGVAGGVGVGGGMHPVAMHGGVPPLNTTPVIGGPATPSNMPPKRRKKTKTSETK